MEPTAIDCTLISKNKEIDAYLEKFKLAMIESITERRIFYYRFNFSAFQIGFYSRTHKVKKRDVYTITVYLQEFIDGGTTVIYPATDHRFKTFEWASKFNGHYREFFLSSNGPEILKFLFQVIKNVFKVDVLIAFS